MANCNPDRPVDRGLFTGRGMHVGAFRLPAHHPDFSNTGPIGGNLLVFPRSSVTITHDGQAAVHADANVIMLYNFGQEYRRGLVDPRGDFSDYFHFDNAILQEAISGFDPSVRDRPGAAFRWTHTACSPCLYFQQRALVQWLSAARETTHVHGLPTPDEDAICESLFALLENALQGIAARVDSEQECIAKKRRTLAKHQDQIQAVLSHLYLNYNQPESLEQIAAQVDLSVFHLSRIFSHQTGQTIHAYRNQLRLRRALEFLESGTTDVTTLAVRLGYASHSHFGQAFRRAFGLPPSQVPRAMLRILLSRNQNFKKQ